MLFPDPPGVASERPLHLEAGCPSVDKKRQSRQPPTSLWCHTTSPVPYPLQLPPLLQLQLQALLTPFAWVPGCRVVPVLTRLENQILGCSRAHLLTLRRRTWDPIRRKNCHQPPTAPQLWHRFFQRPRKPQLAHQQNQDPWHFWLQGDREWSSKHSSFVRS